MLLWHWLPNHETCCITWGWHFWKKFKQNLIFLTWDMQHSLPMFQGSGFYSLQMVMKAHHPRQSFFRATIHFSKRQHQDLKSGLRCSELKVLCFATGSQLGWVCSHRLLRAGQHLKTLNWQRQSEIGAAGFGRERRGRLPSFRSDRCFRRALHSSYLPTKHDILHFGRLFVKIKAIQFLLKHTICGISWN